MGENTALLHIANGIKDIARKRTNKAIKNYFYIYKNYTYYL